MKYIKLVAFAFLGIGLFFSPLMSQPAHAQGVQIIEIKPYPEVKQAMEQAAGDYVAKLQEAEGQRLLAELDTAISGIDKVTADYVALANKDEAALDAAAQAWLTAFENMQAKMHAVNDFAPLQPFQKVASTLRFHTYDLQADQAAVKAIFKSMEDAAKPVYNALKIQTSTYEAAVPYVEEMMANGAVFSNDLAVQGMLKDFKAKLTEAAAAK